MKVEAWVLEMEKLFEIFPHTDAQKVSLAAFTLDDDASRWWMMVREQSRLDLDLIFGVVLHQTFSLKCSRSQGYRISDFDARQ